MRISDWSSDVCSSDLHSYAVAQKIGVKTIICPPAAGVASAFGLLVAPARADRSRTVRVRPASDSLQTLESAYADLEQQARDSLEPLSQTFSPIALSRQAEIGRSSCRESVCQYV